MWHCHGMAWDVLYDETFVAELAEIERHSGSSAVREEIAALALLLRRFGPTLRRPHCDTLKGSKHTNMKELRRGWRGSSRVDMMDEMTTGS